MVTSLDVNMDVGIGDNKHRQPGETPEQKDSERERGKSLLPFSRVQKIIKADKVRLLDEFFDSQSVFDARIPPIGHPSCGQGSNAVDINRGGRIYQTDK